MSEFSTREAAQLLGVSDDTVRRWVDSGALDRVPDASPMRVRGESLARLAQERAAAVAEADPGRRSSARNALTGLVTSVVTDTVMAQVEMQCGPFRVVSLMSREAVEELDLKPGVRATASIKSTNVVVEVH